MFKSVQLGGPIFFYLKQAINLELCIKIVLFLNPHILMSRLTFDLAVHYGKMNVKTINGLVASTQLLLPADKYCTNMQWHHLSAYFTYTYSNTHHVSVLMI